MSFLRLLVLILLQIIVSIHPSIHKKECKRVSYIFNSKRHLLSSRLCEFIASCCCFSFFFPQWICQFCTYANQTPSPRCEMCDLARSDPAPSPSKPLPPSPIKDVTPKSPPVEDPDLKRQRLMREEGLKLIKLIRVRNVNVLIAKHCCWGFFCSYVQIFFSLRRLKGRA